MLFHPVVRCEAKLELPPFADSCLSIAVEQGSVTGLVTDYGRWPDIDIGRPMSIYLA
jgi:hypothetical protein